MFLAIDASTKSSGVAIFENNKLITYDCYTSASTDVIKRIQCMTKKIHELLLANPAIDTIVIEEVRPDQGETNSKTVKALFWLQASLAFLLHDEHSEVKIEYVYPSEWRQRCGIKTGKGIMRDELKKADIAFVKETYNIDNINDDIADAICIGHAYLKDKKEIPPKQITFGI